MVEAADGGQALRLIDAGARPHLLFTDVIMPGMTGRHLAEQARKRLPDLKLLYTSGYTRDAMNQASSIEPAALVLPKPFSVNDLARAVRHTIDSHPVHKSMDVATIAD